MNEMPKQLLDRIDAIGLRSNGQSFDPIHKVHIQKAREMLVCASNASDEKTLHFCDEVANIVLDIFDKNPTSVTTPGRHIITEPISTPMILCYTYILHRYIVESKLKRILSLAFGKDILDSAAIDFFFDQEMTMLLIKSSSRAKSIAIGTFIASVAIGIALIRNHAATKSEIKQQHDTLEKFSDELDTHDILEMLKGEIS